MRAERQRNATARLVRQNERAATTALCEGVNIDVRVMNASGKDNDNGSKGQKPSGVDLSPASESFMIVR